MKKIYSTIFILLVAFSVYSQSEEEYNYPTKLKGGYSILYKVDKDLQYLYLRKGRKIISELSSCSRGLLQKNLGYVGADFTDYFVLVHSFGSGNPHEIELIKKQTGKNLLKNGSAWIDADETKEYLLYSENAVPRKKDKMILLNVKTGKKQYFRFPLDIFDTNGVLNRVNVREITDRQLIIEYDNGNETKVKKYKR